MSEKGSNIKLTDDYEQLKDPFVIYAGFKYTF